MRKIIVWTPINTSGHFPKLENDPKWLARRCEIMNQYVIPSMRAQTCKDFEWWIEVREDTVEFITRRLNIAGLPAVILPRPIVTDHANGKNVAWDRLPEHVQARIDTPEFIEVRLNSDDMYHYEYLEYLHDMDVDGDIKPDTQCILPRQGYYWYLKENMLCKTTHISPPFYALIYNREAWLKGYRHRMKGGHRAARKLRNQDVPGRQWCWIVHEVNNKIVRKGVNNAYKPPNTFRQANLDRLKGFGR